MLKESLQIQKHDFLKSDIHFKLSLRKINYPILLHVLDINLNTLIL